MRGFRPFFAFLVAAVSAVACSDGPSTTGPSTPAAADPGQPLRGMFRYLADAARFRDCLTEQDVPVAMEGAYIEVERAYSNSGIEPGSEILIEVVGRYQERPTMEGNATEINFIIDSFKNLLPDNTCIPTAPVP
jgi:copper homeostasis protein (lipoprotein)